MCVRFRCFRVTLYSDDSDADFKVKRAWQEKPKGNPAPRSRNFRSFQTHPFGLSLLSPLSPLGLGLLVGALLRSTWTGAVFPHLVTSIFRMRVIHRFLAFFTLAVTTATILENGQVRENPYPGQVSAIALDNSWRTYQPDTPEISYKGRWDSQHVSCMSTPHPFLGFSTCHLTSC